VGRVDSLRSRFRRTLILVSSYRVSLFKEKSKESAMRSFYILYFSKTQHIRAYLTAPQFLLLDLYTQVRG